MRISRAKRRKVIRNALAKDCLVDGNDDFDDLLLQLASQKKAARKVITADSRPRRKKSARRGKYVITENEDPAPTP